MTFGKAGEKARLLSGALQVRAVVVHAAVILDALMKGLEPPGLPVREPRGSIEAFYGVGTHEGGDQAAYRIPLVLCFTFLDTHPASPNST